MITVHCLVIGLYSLCTNSLEVIVKCLGSGGSFDLLVEILLLHIESSLDKVAEGVYEVGVITCENAFPSDRSVGCERHFSEGVVTNAVNSNVLGELICINHVSAGLGHLVRAEVEPGVTEDLFGERKIESHEEDGPIDRVESYDVLTDHVYVSGPEFLELLGLLLERLIGIVADCGDVVYECIEPYVNDVLGVGGYLNTPGEGCTGNAEVLKSRKEEVVEHLLLSCLGLEESGVGLEILDKTGSVLLHIEEVCLFLCLLDGSAAIGALAVGYLCVGKEGLAGSAIPALVITLVDITLAEEALEYLLNGLYVIVVGGADEVVIAYVHLVPHTLDDARNVVNVCLGRDA